MLFSYGISEPDVGADVASVRTKAVIDGDEVIIPAQKDGVQDQMSLILFIQLFEVALKKIDIGIYP